jgi:hypothetical protein
MYSLLHLYERESLRARVLAPFWASRYSWMDMAIPSLPPRSSVFFVDRAPSPQCHPRHRLTGLDNLSARWGDLVPERDREPGLHWIGRAYILDTLTLTYLNTTVYRVGFARTPAQTQAQDKHVHTDPRGFVGFRGLTG